jgi:hypothetical protein
MSIEGTLSKEGAAAVDKRPIVDSKKPAGNEPETLPAFQHIVLREWQEPDGLRYMHIRFRQCSPSQVDRER